ncbi:MAG: poly(3-hydroxyalkanoate) depolymerase [Acidovorax sp.]
MFSLEHVTIGGLPLRAGRTPGDGSRPPLLMFNGIGAGIELLAPLAEALPEREVITFDIPGVGGSPPPPLPYRPWHVAWVARRLLKHYGHAQADVLGVSWGGAMAQQFALSASRHCRRLVLCATSGGALMVPGKPEVLLKMATPRRYTDRDYARSIAGDIYGGDCRTNPGVLAGHFKDREHHSRMGYVMQLAAIAGWTSLPWLPLLPQPTLIMAGSDDPLVPLANAKLMHRLIRHSELKVLDCGHMFLLTRLQESAAAIREFLDRP